MGRIFPKSCLFWYKWFEITSPCFLKPHFAGPGVSVIVLVKSQLVLRCACSRFGAGSQARYAGSRGRQQPGGSAEGRAARPKEWSDGRPRPRGGFGSCWASGNICSHSHIIWPHPQGWLWVPVQTEPLQLFDDILFNICIIRFGLRQFTLVQWRKPRDYFCFC